jgi:hypothetical protein
VANGANNTIIITGLIQAISPDDEIWLFTTPRVVSNEITN